MLGNDRGVCVYMPPGYERGGRRCGLLLLFDGWAYTSIYRARTVLDYLIAEGAIPPLLAVFVDHPDFPTRMQELACNPQFDEFVVRELLPWIHTSYEVTSEPTRRIVGGYSRGGLAAAFVALRHPDLVRQRPFTVGRVLLEAGCGHRARMAHTATCCIAVPTDPLVRDVGLYEGLLKGDLADADGDPGMLVANRHLRTILQARGCRVHYSEFSGAHDFGYSRWMFPIALKTLLAD